MRWNNDQHERLLEAKREKKRIEKLYKEKYPQYDTSVQDPAQVDKNSTVTKFKQI